MGLAALLATAAAAPPARPQTPVAWSTYLRAGPGQTFPAISELEHDTRVTVGACDAGWCHVSTATSDGYVDRDALDLPRTPAPSPTGRTACVTALQADNRGPIATRFCSPAPAPRAR